MTLKVQTTWQGGRNEVGEVIGDVINEQISIPSSLEGTGIGTNPDELLVSAASSCYILFPWQQHLKELVIKTFQLHSNPSAMLYLKMQNSK